MDGWTIFWIYPSFSFFLLNIEVGIMLTFFFYPVIPWGVCIIVRSVTIIILYNFIWDFVGKVFIILLIPSMVDTTISSPRPGVEGAIFGSSSSSLIGTMKSVKVKRRSVVLEDSGCAGVWLSSGFDGVSVYFCWRFLCWCTTCLFSLEDGFFFTVSHPWLLIRSRWTHRSSQSLVLLALDHLSQLCVQSWIQLSGDPCQL